MTPEQIEAEFKHVATKGDLHKELHSLSWKLISAMIAIQVPTLVGIIQVWVFLANIANHLPKSGTHD